MSSFVLKIIAIITMFCDHFGDIFIGSISPFNIIGRIAFPIFCFQLVVGYENTKDIKKYALRLIAFALISQIPFKYFLDIFAGGSLELNVCFTLLLGLLALLVYDKIPNIFLKYISIFIILIVAYYTKVDYGAWGVFLILFIYIFCPNKYVSSNNINKNAKNFIFIFGFLSLCIINYCGLIGLVSNIMLIGIILFSFLPSILMLLYNGKKGPSLKYLFYAFYPVHLILLEIIYEIVKLN